MCSCFLIGRLLERDRQKQLGNRCGSRASRVGDRQPGSSDRLRFYILFALADIIGRPLMFLGPLQLGIEEVGQGCSRWLHVRRR